MQPDELRIVLAVYRDNTLQKKQIIESDAIKEMPKPVLLDMLRGLVRAYEDRIALERTDAALSVAEKHHEAVFGKPLSETSKAGLTVIDGGKA